MTSWADKVECEINQDDFDISLNRTGDKFNYYGINITSQKRRQEQVPWTSVKYNKQEYNIKPPPITRQYAQTF